MFWETVIVDWEKFFDKNGQPIPCTKENKMILMSRSSKFVKLVMDLMKELADYDADQAERAEKN